MHSNLSSNITNCRFHGVLHCVNPSPTPPPSPFRFSFLKTCLSQLYNSKSSKTKPKDLHYISDKNYNDSKKNLYINYHWRRLQFRNTMLLYNNKDMKPQSAF